MEDRDKFWKSAATEIRAEIARRKTTYDEFSIQCGIHKSTLYARVQGHRPFNLEQLQQVLDALGLTVTEFVIEVATRMEK